jgi:hypothetical protein
MSNRQGKIKGTKMVNCGMRSLAYRNRFPKIRPQQFPSSLPAIALDQTPQGQDRLTSRSGPGHPGLLQTLGHQGFTRGFHDPTGNRLVLAHISHILNTLAFPPRQLEMDIDDN